MPEYDKDGNKYTYSIEEINVLTGYTTTISKNNNEYTITNTYDVKSTTISVNKKWVNGEQLDKIPSIVVGLYYKKTEDDELTKIAEVVLSDSNNWTHTFKKGDGIFDILPENYIYVVKEIGYYDVTESEKEYYEENIETNYSQNKNNWTITNIYTNTYVLPETGSNVIIVQTIITGLLLGTPIIYLVYTFIKRDI